jgi:Uma2 family endonuclease
VPGHCRCPWKHGIGWWRRAWPPLRGELLRGVIVEKIRKSPLHTKITARLWKALTNALGDNYWVRKEEPLTLADSEPEPDLAVVQGQEADYAAHPTTALLVIEVAVTSLADDRELVQIYAEAGVAEFWIVNAPGRVIEVYRQSQDGHYLHRKSEPPGLHSPAIRFPD